MLFLATAIQAQTIRAQVYFPSRLNYGSPTEYKLTFEEVFFKSSDKTALHAWLIHTRQDKRIGTIIHFHGNAQNLTAHMHGVAWLADHGFDLFIFDYRGFGLSQGEPKREGVYQDCIAAVHEAIRHNGEEEAYILYGQSLGAANALAVMGDRQFSCVRGLVAESSFYSYKKIAADRPSPLNEDFDESKPSRSPHEVIAKISPKPVLLIHGTNDQVVPYEHSAMLFEKAKAPKELWAVPQAGHMGIFIRNHPERHERLLQTLKKWVAEERGTKHEKTYR